MEPQSQRCLKPGTIRAKGQYPPDCEIAPKGRTAYIYALKAEMRKIRRAAKKGMGPLRRAVEEADATMDNLENGREPPKESE